MSEVAVQSAREALELLKRAAKARQSAGTGVNEHSSRSHAVITIKLQSAADSSAAVAADGGSAVVSSLHAHMDRLRHLHTRKPCIEGHPSLPILYCRHFSI